MNKNNMKILHYHFILLAIILLFLNSIHITYAQNIRWLSIGEAQTFINEIGAEYENEATFGNTCFLTWPTQYGRVQQTTRSKALWIGCTDFEEVSDRLI